MLRAFEEYYGIEYTPRMRSALLDRIGNPPKAYLLELYRMAIEQVEARWGKLPDLAAIVRIQQQLPEAFTFSTDYQPILTEDAGLDVEDVKAKLAKVAAEDGEPNHRERERIRHKKGATVEERFWIWCIDNHGGDWRSAWARRRDFNREAV
jgi:hypothetical protein